MRWPIHVKAILAVAVTQGLFLPVADAGIPAGQLSSSGDCCTDAVFIPGEWLTVGPIWTVALSVDWKFVEDVHSDNYDWWWFEADANFAGENAKSDNHQTFDPDFGEMDTGEGNLLLYWNGGEFNYGRHQGTAHIAVIHREREWGCPWCAWNVLSSSEDAGTIVIDNRDPMKNNVN